MMPWTVAILMSVQAFFHLLIAFVVSPFNVLMQGRGIVDVGDGQGLNPLLQYWTMVDPSADPVSRLCRLHGAVRVRHGFADHRKQTGEEWIHTTRRWAIVTWFFQSTGHSARRGLGLRGSRLGRLLGLGSG